MARSRQPAPDYNECRFLRRHDLQFCKDHAVVTFDYADGVGACQAHVAPVLLWCMGKNGPGEIPVDNVVAVPTQNWEDYALRWRE